MTSGQVKMMKMTLLAPPLLRLPQSRFGKETGTIGVIPAPAQDIAVKDCDGYRLWFEINLTEVTGSHLV